MNARRLRNGGGRFGERVVAGVCRNEGFKANGKREGVRGEIGARFDERRGTRRFGRGVERRRDALRRYRRSLLATRTEDDATGQTRGDR